MCTAAPALQASEPWCQQKWATPTRTEDAAGGRDEARALKVGLLSSPRCDRSDGQTDGQPSEVLVGPVLTAAPTTRSVCSNQRCTAPVSARVRMRTVIASRDDKQLANSTRPSRPSASTEYNRMSLVKPRYPGDRSAPVGG